MTLIGSEKLQSDSLRPISSSTPTPHLRDTAMSKKRKLNQSKSTPVSRRKDKNHHQKQQSQKQSAPPKPKPKSKAPALHPKPSPIVPFGKEDKVLLVGEGDFSFAASLIKHHGVRHLTATSYDGEKELLEKYPQAGENVEAVRSTSGTVMHGIDATKMHKVKAIKKRKGEKKVVQEEKDEDGDEGEEWEEEWEEEKNEERGKTTNQDGTAGFDVIGFMFPHVGGLSTDMDRQIRANQGEYFPLYSV
jgi:25S rRNA (uracil2634-N3)-methyltransferase